MSPSRNFIAIDPGKLYFGWAWFKDGELEGAGKTDRDGVAQLALLAPECIVEKQWGVSKKSTVADIIELAIATGEYGGHFALRRYLLPYQTPKPIRHTRALNALGTAERLRLPKQKTYLKHTLCAVYIGLKELDRI